MARRVSRKLLVAAAVSLALITGLLGWVGWRAVARAVEALGWGGFAAFTLVWVPVVAVAGLGWAAAAAALRRRPLTFVWARMLREAAADVLPVSQLGGLVVGSRALLASGVDSEVALAATLVDLAAEIAAQALYTLLGIALILARVGGDVPPQVLWPAAGAVLLMLLGFTVFLFGHGPAVGLLGRLAWRWMPDSTARAEEVAREASASFADARRMTLAVLFHLAGWIGGGGASWLALRLMGAPAPFWAILAMESLMYAVRNIGFMLPASLGVQEGAYVLLGPMFGIAPTDALALSLLRRARDLAIGVPVLLVWQGREGRLLWRRRAETRAS